MCKITKHVLYLKSRFKWFVFKCFCSYLTFLFTSFRWVFFLLVLDCFIWNRLQWPSRALSIMYCFEIILFCDFELRRKISESTSKRVSIRFLYLNLNLWLGFSSVVIGFKLQGKMLNILYVKILEVAECFLFPVIIIAYLFGKNI